MTHRKPAGQMSPAAAYLVRFVFFVSAFIFITLIVIMVSEQFAYPCRSRRVFSEKNGLSDLVLQTGKTSPLYIIIDAGHGGEDGGAVSADGISEKNLNLDIAQKVACFLQLSDYYPVMIRTEDRLMYEPGQENRKKYYDITNRIHLAEGYEPAIFVSVHQNKFPIRKYKGFQVYYSGNHPAGARLAETLQSNVKQYIQPDNHRLVKTADQSIRILDTLKMPAILAECGFLSNESEAALLNTEEYRSKLAYVIFASIMQFAKDYEEPKI